MVRSKEAIVKLLKHLVLMGLALLLLAACAPTLTVQDNILPTLVSVTVRQDVVVLQGRYFGAPGETSYVVIGADSSGQGGFRIPDVREWNSNRIVVGAPSGVGIGFALVVVDGVRSNVLPINR
jgi:hypothetical protein